jgi:hypothetical protein
MPAARAAHKTLELLAELAESQDGVARRRQLGAVGLTPDYVTAQIDARRWQAVGPVVVVMHNGPLTHNQQCWAAVLHCGRDAALAGRTAAAKGGLVGWESPDIHVVVRRGATIPDLPGVPLAPHQSRTHSTQEIQPGSSPPRVRLPRAVVQAAIWSRDQRAACGVACAAVQQRLSTPARLRLALVTAGRVRHRPLLVPVIHDVEGGAHALSEIDFGRLCRRYRLPVVARQVVRRDPGGRRRYLDVTLLSADGRVVRAEVDGALHLRPMRYWSDMWRQNERVIAGEPILRFSSVAVRVDEAKVADQLARALGMAPAAPHIGSLPQGAGTRSRNDTTDGDESGRDHDLEDVDRAGDDECAQRE